MRLLLIIVSLMFQSTVNAQLSDLITVKKKNGRILKSFTSGTPISFTTTSGYEASGIIRMIRDDTLFLTYWDVRTFMTQYGVTRVDTITSYTDAFAFDEIGRIEVFRSNGPVSRLGRLLMIGSAGYLALNAVNSVYQRVPLSDSRNLRTMAISAGGIGAGYMLKSLFRSDRYTNHRHRIEYVQLR